MILIISVFVALAGLFTFFPKYGFLVLLKKSSESNKKILIENILKYLHVCEQKQLHAETGNIASALSVSVNKLKPAFGQLVDQGLIKSENNFFLLTNSGREYALQIIRTHRLWETYLAEETVVSESKWHEMAEKMEHRLKPDETERLAARLGKPLYDPHGDPIPPVSGNLPEEMLLTLKDFKIGNRVRVLHIEDEPPAVYKSIVKKGIQPGSVFTVLSKTDNESKIGFDNKNITLDVNEIKNINVVLETGEEETLRYQTLSSLKIGKAAVIKSISNKCRGQQRRRLLDLGILPGSTVVAEIKSTSGDPVAYRIKEALIALRKQQADIIYIDKQNEKGN